MPSSNDEVERLKRLRDRQLAARDPHNKQRKIQRTVTRKYRARKRVTFKELFGDIPHKWRGILYGFLGGLIAWIVLAVVFQEEWVDYVGILLIVVLTLFGFIFGVALDTRDNLRDV